MPKFDFEELLVRLLEGSLSANEHTILMEQLEQNTELADRVVRAVTVDDLLQEHVDNGRAEAHARWTAELVKDKAEQILLLQQAVVRKDNPTPQPTSGQPFFRRRGTRTMALRALVGLILVAGLFPLRLIINHPRGIGTNPEAPLVADPTDIQQPVKAIEDERLERWRANQQTPQRVATVAGMTADISPKFSVGDEFGTDDRISLHKGSLRLFFPAGVEAILSGPAEIEFVSAMQVILRTGRFTALAEPLASGFTVITRHADVVDLGTSFGVGVEQSGAADVLVFEGIVDVHFDGNQGLPTRSVQRLTVGEAVHVLETGGVSPVKMVEESLQDAGWSTTFNDAASPLKSISDNVVGPGQANYYALVRGGFQEDARAYVDRTYEWNSFSGEEFPDVLRGADYVRTANRQKLNLDLEISLEIQRDCDLYILVDARIPPPTWLKQSFTKTVLKIGMDEYRPRAVPSLYTAVGPELESARTLGKGPGTSVDQRFHVWKRSIQTGDLITLGSAVDRSAANSILQYELNELSMYGIVLVSKDAQD